MAKQYGIIKIDQITYTTGTTGNEGDASIDVSGLARISESGITVTGTISGVSGILESGLFGDGTLTDPSITFIDDQDVGIYRPGADQLGIVAGGVHAIFINGGDVTLSGETSANSINATGEILARTLQVSGATTITGALTAGGDFLTSGTSSVSGLADFGSGINVSGDVQMASLNGGPLAGFRNKVINGACQIAQRATQVTGITSSQYSTCDRLKPTLFSLGTWTIDQATDAPVGFTKSFKMTCTTADSSPAATAYSWVSYRIEAQDLQDLKYGSPDAETLTLSFYVKSNKIGGASVEIRQSDASRIYTTSYNIDAADTWEYKTITIPGDVSGLIDDDNGSGLQVEWWLNSGSNFTGGSSQGWAANTNPNRNFANLGVGGAVSDYFAITGLQLEVSPVATPFEHRSIGTELALCKRYYQELGEGFLIKLAGSTTSRGNGFQFTQEMRAAPTCTLFNNASLSALYRSGSAQSAAAPTATISAMTGCIVDEKVVRRVILTMSDTSMSTDGFYVVAEDFISADAEL